MRMQIRRKKISIVGNMGLEGYKLKVRRKGRSKRLREEYLWEKNRLRRKVRRRKI